MAGMISREQRTPRSNFVRGLMTGKSRLAGRRGRAASASWSANQQTMKAVEAGKLRDLNLDIRCLWYKSSGRCGSRQPSNGAGLGHVDHRLVVLWTWLLGTPSVLLFQTHGFTSIATPVPYRSRLPPRSPEAGATLSRVVSS